ncbi:glutaredoxin [Nitrosopumilus maritimus SCM1]|uniref:Glutaredoxin n=2 Tax=Nitrosopumilus maritimus TaxID=338192 RepID=A9A5N6_NITMS|nr:glutaredoxin [Nitrosopumilus maritimus SCM1]
MEKIIVFVVPAVNGHLKIIQSNLKMNHKIEILTTPSCGNCKVVEAMLDEMNIKYTVIDVTEKPEYLEKYPIFTAPGVVIDDKLVFTGIPKKHELLEKLSA